MKLSGPAGQPTLCRPGVFEEHALRPRRLRLRRFFGHSNSSALTARPKAVRSSSSLIVLQWHSSEKSRLSTSERSKPTALVHSVILRDGTLVITFRADGRDHNFRRQLRLIQFENAAVSSLAMNRNGNASSATVCGALKMVRWLQRYRGGLKYDV
jgi:hypothetical protein